MTEPEMPPAPSDDERLLLINHLREARERKGWSQEDLSDRTRISLHVLSGLESGNFDVVEPPCLRAFLRTYARHVGVPVEEVNAVFPEPRAKVETPPEGEEDRSIPIVARSRVPWGTIFKVVVVAAALAGVWWWQPWVRREPVARPAPHLASGRADTSAGRSDTTDTLTANLGTGSAPADTSLPTGEPVLRPLATLPAVDVRLPPQPALGPRVETMTLRATDTVWVQIVQGDSTVIYDAIMTPGIQRQWKVQDTLRVTLGRYWAVELLLDNRKVDVPRVGTRNTAYFLCTPSGLARQ